MPKALNIQVLALAASHIEKQALALHDRVLAEFGSERDRYVPDRIAAYMASIESLATMSRMLLEAEARVAAKLTEQDRAESAQAEVRA